MASAVILRVNLALLGVLGGYRRAPCLRETKEMSDVQREIAHEVIVGDGQTFQDLQDIQALPKAHFFGAFHGGTGAVLKSYSIWIFSWSRTSAGIQDCLRPL